MKLVYEKIDRDIYYKTISKVDNMPRLEYNVHSLEHSFIFDEIKHPIILRIYFYGHGIHKVRIPK